MDSTGLAYYTVLAMDDVSVNKSKIDVSPEVAFGLMATLVVVYLVAMYRFNK